MVTHTYPRSLTRDLVFYLPVPFWCVDAFSRRQGSRMESLVGVLSYSPVGLDPVSYVDRVVSFLGSVLLVTQIPGPQWVDG